ncbi:alpha-amylase family glycosyl hydrolase [Hymenobacter sp. BT559]|uniref:alpha-amylase family glycosyl hydrolase n=1 Tax=Hymenobacter sp. BT559 TaxID=2795729 RepID=UPI0018EB9C02|nr:alpha-amylase family glycosyl hydrolase [Hymenobacter sp. BT559]MBJ6142147.1 T9SS type A sorting domain-containing protein [Hymenobacter sp. BT559]
MKKPRLWGLGWLAVLLAGWVSAAHAQAVSPVSVSPAFFTDTTPITLTYDATLGNAGLANYTGDVYIYTGVITNLSTSPSNWQHVVNPTGFGTPTAAEKMTAIGNHKYTISFTPRTFYPGLASSTETVKQLAMVFRGANGSPEGKGVGNTDIYVNLGLQVAFTSPSATTTVAAGTSVAVTATANVAATLTLTLNGTQVAQQANTTTLSANVTVNQPGVNTLVVSGTDGNVTSTATATVLVPPTVTTAPLPAGAKADGITYLNGGTSAILSLTAPKKSYIYVLGEFNNWQTSEAGLLKKTATVDTDAATGRWWVQVDGLTPGQEYAYQFLVDGQLRIADPYCEKILDPDNDKFIPAETYPNLKAYPTGKTTGLVSVLSPGEAAYTWTTTNFQRPARANMVVYELLVRDFVARHDYQTLRDTLSYIQRLGANVIELMPINEFDGNENWGYSPSFYFAPDKYYGTKNNLKALIDECHKRGIAVVLDMVLNHSTGNSPMVQLYGNVTTGPTADNPWFNTSAPHPYSVYNDLNHESAYTRYFSKQVIKFWLQEYHIDGYRYDLAGGFSQVAKTEATFENYDATRVAIWKDYYDAQMSADNGAGSYPILEFFAKGVSDTNPTDEGKVLSDYGMMLWGNLNHSYNEATMGYLGGSDLSYGYYGGQGGRNWGQPNVIAYMESHDEERLQFKNKTYGNSNNSAYDVKNPAIGLQRNELAAAFFFTQPGARLVWQFGELGYDYSINTCADGTTINNDCRTGNKPIRWDYYKDANRRHLYDTYRALIALKKQPAFAAPTAYTQTLGGNVAVKTISLTGAELSVVTVGNFDVTAQTATVTFPQIGTWYNYLTGEQLTIASTNQTMTLQPGQYAVYTSRQLTKPTGTTLATTGAQAASVFKLSLVPNPAAGTTTVAYELPTGTTATIAVQNLLGQTVRQLAPARQVAGAQAQSLSLQGLAPGVYLVKLQAGDQAQTARLLVN